MTCPSEDDRFGELEAGRGESLANTHWDDKYTCPGCHAEHRAGLAEGEARFIRCECGAPLRLELLTAPEPTATIADLDEEEEHLK